MSTRFALSMRTLREGSVDAVQRPCGGLMQPDDKGPDYEAAVPFSIG